MILFIFFYIHTDKMTATRAIWISKVWKMADRKCFKYFVCVKLRFLFHFWHRFISAAKCRQQPRMLLHCYSIKSCYCYVFFIDCPKEDAEEASKDLFYQSLEQIICEIPKQNMTLILDKFSAMICEGVRAQPFIDEHSLHKTFNDYPPSTPET